MRLKPAGKLGHQNISRFERKCDNIPSSSLIPPPPIREPPLSCSSTPSILSPPSSLLLLCPNVSLCFPARISRTSRIWSQTEPEPQHLHQSPSISTAAPPQSANPLLVFVGIKSNQTLNQSTFHPHVTQSVLQIKTVF